MVGPSELVQDRTCVSGQTCAIDGLLGLHLSDLDKLAILETCGTEAIVTRIPQTGNVVEVTSTGTVVSWGSIALTSLGGLYRLCWCSDMSNPYMINQTAYAAAETPYANFTAYGGSECAEALSFVVDAGSLTLIGPSPLQQDRTCASGQTCRIDGIIGVGLKHEDSVMILNTCSESFPVPRLPGEGISTTIAQGTNVSNRVASQGLNTTVLPTSFSGAIEWGSVAFSAAGGQYALCWCAAQGPGQCISQDSFRTQLGSMTLIGPTPLEQDKT
jgi:hypothetical protein